MYTIIYNNIAHAYFEYTITLSLKWVLLDLMLLNSTEWKVQLSKSTWLNIILVNLQVFRNQKHRVIRLHLALVKDNSPTIRY